MITKYFQNAGFISFVVDNFLFLSVFIRSVLTLSSRSAKPELCHLQQAHDCTDSKNKNSKYFCWAKFFLLLKWPESLKLYVKYL